MRLNVYTLNETIVDYRYLFGLWESIHDSREDVTFDFTGCGFLRQNAIAFLGGLSRLILRNSGTVTFDQNTMQERVRLHLTRNGFLHAFGNPQPATLGTSIPYREDMGMDKKALATYLKDQWLGRGWIQVSALLRDEIVSRVVEIYDNAFSHAQSAVGVISSGQYYPQLKQLKLTAVDFGIGIPANVRAFLRVDVSAPDSLQWALKFGNTTKPSQIGRGLGLDLLKRFVITNRGTLEIFSGGGYAVFSEYVERYDEVQPAFEGTLVTISLRCDERYYVLASETLNNEPLF